MNQKYYIKRALQEMGKTQKEISLESEISKSTINGYYNGTSEPNLLNLRFLKKYLNVSYEYLLGDSDNKEQKNFIVGNDLGLTDKSIEKLKKYNNKKTTFNVDIFYGDEYNTNSYIDLLNNLIEDERFGALLYWIRKYINLPAIKHYEEKVRIKELQDKISNETDEIEKEFLNAELDSLYNKNDDTFKEATGIDYSNTTVDDISVAQFKSSELFNNIISDMFINQSKEMFENWEIVKDKNEKMVVRPVCKDGSETNKFFGYKITNNDDNVDSKKG